MTKNRRLSRFTDTAALFDELLVVRAQSGDRLAGERLYKRWNPKLVSAAHRYSGDLETAHDLAQECWLGIWKGLAGLRNPARFRSYIFAVLHRRGADHLRGFVREHEAMSARSAVVEPIEAPQSESAAIAQAFAKLPADQRLAAHLYFVEGLTLGEIAEVQSIPEGTAKSRLFHARQKLKAALNPEDDRHTTAHKGTKT